MKKVLRSATVLLSAMALLATSACAGDSDKKPSGSGEIELSIFAGSLPEASPQGAGVKKMVDYINEQDAGLKAIGFFDTALGDATTMVQGLQQGTVDIGVSGNSYYSGLIPEIQVFELPFLFDNLEAARAATAPGEARDAIFKHFDDKSIVGLSIWEGGMRQLSNNVRPILSPDDLAGIKLRTLPSPIQQAAWSALGAMPQSIDSAELYTALQQGTVSGQENPLAEIVFRKMYEVQNYVSMTSHVYTPHTMSVSKATWDSLSDEQKQVVQDAAEIGRQENLDANDVAEAAARETLIENGVQIDDDIDREKFVELGKSVWPQFVDQYGSDILDLLN